MSEKAEIEFKEIMEKAGWKVIKIYGDTSLSSSNYSYEDHNFIDSIKSFFGHIGLPDFLLIKGNYVGFVEVKYKGKLTQQQEKKLEMLQSFLNVWCYVAHKSNNDITLKEL